MGGLTITLPGEAVLFSIKTVITRGGVTPPPTEGILADLDGAHPCAAETSRFSPPSAAASLAAAEAKEKERLRESLGVNPPPPARGGGGI